MINDFPDTQILQDIYYFCSLAFAICFVLTHDFEEVVTREILLPNTKPGTKNQGSELSVETKNH